MATPLISVVMPTHNRAGYLREAVTGVQEQSVTDFELLIVDDCSTDDTAAFLDELERSDSRVRVFKTPANSGCNLARNLAIEQTRGRFVAFIDDDDRWLPSRLEDGVEALERNLDATVASCAYAFIDASGNRRLRADGAPSENVPCDVESGSLFEMLYCDWHWYPTSTLTFRAEIFRRHRYPEIRRSDGDFILLSRMAALGSSLTGIRTVGTLMRRDTSYEFMSRDRWMLLQAHRQSLDYLRSWLGEQGISDFDHLHGRSRANQLIREARYQGGVRGVLRLAGAAMLDPGNRRVREHARRLMKARRKVP